MKVFFSHSWKDKTSVDILAQNLSSMIDLWLDLHHLRSGERFTPSTDNAIESMDLVILLWSQNAATSDTVAAEIDTALRLGKQIILCRLDETTLDPRIREIKAIEMQDFKKGCVRLLVTLLAIFSKKTNIDLDNAIGNTKDFDEVIAYLEKCRNKQGLKENKKENCDEQVIESFSTA